MPIIYDDQACLVQMVWNSANFATGGGTSSFGLNLDAIDPPALGDLANGIRDAWTANLRTITDSNYRLERIRLETQTLSGEFGAALDGTGSIVSPPPNTSMLISYTAVQKGPRSRGRNYWPGMLPEGDIDERGNILASRVTSLQAAFGAFFTAVAAIDGVVGQAIVQTDEPGQASAPILPWPSVQSRAVQSLAATQRRRLRR